MTGKAMKANVEVEAMTIVSNAVGTPSYRVLSTIEPKAPSPQLVIETPPIHRRRINGVKSPTRRIPGKNTIRSQMVSPMGLSVTPSMNNYRMIGLKAVLNSTDS